MVESLVKVQNELVKQNKNSDMKSLLLKMTQDFKENIGNVITQDTEELLTTISANFETIDNNFNSL
jgi:hypothetical protein